MNPRASLSGMDSSVTEADQKQVNIFGAFLVARGAGVYWRFLILEPGEDDLFWVGPFDSAHLALIDLQDLSDELEDLK